jgi:hypothetical protein
MTKNEAVLLFKMVRGPKTKQNKTKNLSEGLGI